MQRPNPGFNQIAENGATAKRMVETQQQFRFTALDVARFVAAMSVVLYHYNPWLSTAPDSPFALISRLGYLGVPLFFIISGFVISASALNRSALAFAVSRFTRLYPAYWAAIAATLFVAYLFLGEIEDPLTIAANLTMLNDYVGIKDIDGVYWTLQVELKFYACVFLLILFGVFDKYRIWLPAWLGLTIIYALTEQPFFMGWFITPHYSCFFIAGAAFYMIWKDGGDYLLYSVLLGAFALSIIKAFEQVSGFVTAPDQATRFAASIIVAGMFVFFWAMTTGRIQPRARPIYLTLGALTYPLYLLHNRAGKAVIEYGSELVSGRTAAIATICTDVRSFVPALSIHRAPHRLAAETAAIAIDTTLGIMAQESLARQVAAALART